MNRTGRRIDPNKYPNFPQDFNRFVQQPPFHIVVIDPVTGVEEGLCPAVVAVQFCNSRRRVQIQNFAHRVLLWGIGASFRINFSSGVC